jgi:hypothetical protein
LADKAGPSGKAPMLVRALAYYERFLALHKSADIGRDQASLAAAKVEEALGRLGPAGSAVRSDGTAKTGRWIELLQRVDPQRDTAAGQWTLAGGLLRPLSCGEPAITFPCTLGGSYELSAVFAPSEYDWINVILPLGSAEAVLVLGHLLPTSDPKEKPEVRIDTLLRGPAPSLQAPSLLIKDKDNTLGVKVLLLKDDRAEISADLNGKPALQWQGPCAAFSYPPWLNLKDPRRLTVRLSGTMLTLKSLKLRALDEKSKLAR